MLVLEGGTLIDGLGSDPKLNAPITIKGDRITRIGDRESGDDVTAIDVSGLTVLPGLVDLHTHLGSIDYRIFVAPGTTTVAEVAAQIFRNSALALDAGFTTVRDTGGVDDGVVRAINRGFVRGPRVMPSGPFLVQTGGHGCLIPTFSDATKSFAVPGLYTREVICDGPDQVRHAARQNFRRGATQVKMMISGGVVSFSDNMDDTQFTVEEMKAAVEEAKARGTYVCAHAHGNASILLGLEAGITCFEHATYLNEGTAAAIAQAGAAIVPTLTVTNLLTSEWEAWGLPAAVVPRIAGVEQAMTTAILIAKEAGILLGSGSDLLGADQNRRGLEIVLKAKVLSPMEAIVSATLNSARIAGLAKQIGSVEVGKLADLIAVDGDPLQEPELFDQPNRVKLVIKNGQVVKDTRVSAIQPVLLADTTNLGF